MRNAEISSLKHFAKSAAGRRWRVDSTAFVDEVHCCLRSSGRFRLRSCGHDEGVILSNLEWVGIGDDWSDLMRDFWSVFGACSDKIAYVTRHMDGPAPGLTVVTGDAESGHVMRFNFVGEKIDRIRAAAAS